jgi:hypothetical protein
MLLPVIRTGPVFLEDRLRHALSLEQTQVREFKAQKYRLPARKHGNLLCWEDSIW